MHSMLVSIHALDPRGTKVGGIETHVRQLLRCHPADIRILLIGVDELGDLVLGQKVSLTIAGREIDFVPVLRLQPEEQIGAAQSVRSTVTFRFAAALLRRLFTLRGLVAGTNACAEVERFELALPARALGIPLVVVAHNGGRRGDKMDSLLARHWWAQQAAEWVAFRLATRIFCVSPQLLEHVRTRHASQQAKAQLLTVSVDTELFRAAPFARTQDGLRLVYAGRLDQVKDPPLMFRAVKRLHERLNGAFTFDYCGASDPYRFAEFADIAAFTKRHGALRPEAVAAVMSAAHIGLLVSFAEGMPCFLLELLASGRPFAGLRLPQFDPLVKEGVSGRMVERGADIEATADAVADAILSLWRDIQAGHIDPGAVHRQILPFSVERQLARMFDVHRTLAAANGRRRWQPASAGGRNG